MKKTFFTICNLMIFSLVLTSASNTITQQNIDDKKQSPFVGSWDWEKNSPEEDSFYIWVGERNDSLLFSIGGIFHGGQKIHMPERDYLYYDIPIVKEPLTNGNIVKSKISEAYSNFYFNPKRMHVYNEVSFELKNDSTMLFILDDNKGYWPDTAIMKRRDSNNKKFSYEEGELLYRE